MTITIKTDADVAAHAQSPAASPPRCWTCSRRTSSPASPPTRLDKIAHDHIVNVQQRDSRAAELRAARLHAVPEVDLHLDQPPGLPRHPERPAAQERRHRQHRRHRHQGRLARRHQPHVRRRRRLDRRQAPVPDHLRRDVERHRQGQARAFAWATSATRSRPSPRANGFSVVREFCGHGIGTRFHEEPQVLHYGRPGTLDELKPGMTFTIEPMINAGRRDIREAGDGWTIVTRTVRCRRSGSTRCSSPRPATR